MILNADSNTYISCNRVDEFLAIDAQYKQVHAQIETVIIFTLFRGIGETGAWTNKKRSQTTDSCFSAHTYCYLE